MKHISGTNFAHWLWAEDKTSLKIRTHDPAVKSPVS